MLRGILSVFGADGNENGDDDAVPVPSAGTVSGRQEATNGDIREQPSNLNSVDQFNAAIARIHELSADGNVYDTLDVFEVAEQIVRDTAYHHVKGVRRSREPEGNRNNCPHCGRRVASVALHAKTCSALAAIANANDATSSPSTAAEPVDPRAEMLFALRARVCEQAHVRLLQAVSSGEAEDARLCWCTAASLADMDAATSLDPHSDPSSLFAALVESAFVGYAEDVSERLQAARRGVGVDDRKEDGEEKHPAHPLLLRHSRAVRRAASKLVPTPNPVHNDGRQPDEEDEDVEGGFLGDGGHAPTVEAVAALLGEAATWLERIREQKAPHSARLAVATRLVTACTRAVVPALEEHARECGMDAVQALARACTDHAEGRCIPSDYVRPDAWAWEWDTLGRAWQVSRDKRRRGREEEGREEGGFGRETHETVDEESEGDAAVQRRRDLACLVTALREREEPILSVKFNAVGGRKKGGAGASAPTLPPLPIPLPVAVAVLDEVADQTVFLAAVLERFIRHASAALASGKYGEPTRGTDELSASLQGLQGSYVLLERAYLLNAVQLAVHGGPRPDKVWLAPSAQGAGRGGPWDTVAVHEDMRVRTFAWCDAVFFIASKSLARACGSGCDMAAAGVTNFVAGCVDEEVRSVTRACLALCGRARRVGGSVGGKAGTQAEEEDVEQHLALALQQALSHQLQGGGTAPKTESVPPPVKDKRSDMDSEDVDVTSLPPVADEAVCAANTIATVGAYAASLYARAAGELASVFPPPMEDEEGVAGSSLSCPVEWEWDPPALGTRLRVHPYLASPLDMLHNAAASYAYVVGSGKGGAGQTYADQAASALLHAAAGPGLAAFTAALASTSYVLSDGEYERARAGLSAREGGGGAASGTGLAGGLPGRNGGGESLGPTDPALAAFSTGVMAATRLHILLPLLIHPVLPDALVKALACAAARAFEEGWRLPCCTGMSVSSLPPSPPPPPVNEYGALLKAGQVRAVQAALEAYARKGSHRPPFSRVSQAVSVLGLDAPHDLYSLSFPRPVLTQGEVVALMTRRGWGATANKLNWDRVQAVKDSDHESTTGSFN